MLTINDREAVQIAVYSNRVVAVCSDGTMWVLMIGGDEAWRQLPQIPQKEKRE